MDQQQHRRHKLSLEVARIVTHLQKTIWLASIAICTGCCTI